MRNTTNEERRVDILTALRAHDDGTGTLAIIVDQALADDPEVTVETVREIVREAESDARADAPQTALVVTYRLIYQAGSTVDLCVACADSDDHDQGALGEVAHGARPGRCQGAKCAGRG